MENYKWIYSELENELVNLSEAQQVKNTQSMDKIKLRITEIENDFACGAFYRTASIWHEQGEKPTKYFLGLEKRQGSAKLMTKIKQEDGSIITEQKLILEEQMRFYKKLYMSWYLHLPVW